MAQILDSAGNVVFPAAPTAAYMASFFHLAAATDAAGSAVVALRNPAASTKTLYMRNIRGRASFQGTAAAAHVGFDFIRFSGGDPSGGTTMTRVKKRSGYAASQVLDANAQYRSGILTMTSVVYDPNGPFHVVRIPASVTGVVSEFDVDWMAAGATYEPFELAPGEGIAIRQQIVAIIGTSIAGSIEWDER